MERTGITNVTIAGGVAANSRLRQRMIELSETLEVRVFYPEFEYCTDNGAMIAYAGWMALQHDRPTSLHFTAEPRLSISSL